MWAVMQELAVSGSYMLLAVAAVLVIPRLVALMIALKDAEPGHRPEIIRALAELMRWK